MEIIKHLTISIKRIFSSCLVSHFETALFLKHIVFEISFLFLGTFVLNISFEKRKKKEKKRKEKKRKKERKKDKPQLEPNGHLIPLNHFETPSKVKNQTCS